MKAQKLSTIISVLMILIAIDSSYAQKKKLTYKQVYQKGEPKLLGKLPRIIEWFDDGHYLEMKSDKEHDEHRIMKVDAATGEAIVFIDFKALVVKLPQDFKMSNRVATTKDYDGFLFNHKNDLYYFCKSTGVFKQFTDTPQPEKNPKFSPNGQLVAYTRDHNLYFIELESGLEHQLTVDGNDTIYNGWASWVYYEEILGRRSRYAAFWWSPNSEMIAFLRFDDSAVPVFHILSSDGAHGELETQRYPKSGDPNPTVKLGIAHLKRDEITWVEVDEKADYYVAWPQWTPDNKQLFFQWKNRGQDSIKIISADPVTGDKEEVYVENQSSWVDFFEDLYFFKDGSGFLLRTDVDGWSHLYFYDLNDRLKRRLTKGEWSVKEIVLVDDKNKMIYFRGSMNNSVESHLYRVDYKGKNVEQLTTIPGTHRCKVSPEGSYFIDTYSNINQPTKMALYSMDGTLIRLLGDQKLSIMDEYELGQVELFTIPAGDGIQLPTIWALPYDFKKSEKYPVLFRVYGGPGATDVSNSFKRLRDYFFAQNGIITISVDHRGSSHFGKKGMALMHRNLGKWEMNDYIAAVKWLRQLQFIDSTRIGISGGSYGGYVACLALTYGADYFTHGVAHYSVTDWKLYDTVYTERFMDAPNENPEGYKFGSVMTHADKYKGKLLITHGTMDDNVHMQNTIQFIDKLQDLNKDFDLILYPNERHGVGNPKRNHFTREEVQFWFRHFLGKEFVLEENEG